PLPSAVFHDHAHPQHSPLSLHDALPILDQAYTNFFRKRANFPKYKEKFRNDSIRFPQGVELDEVKQQIRLPKIGWMGYRKSRDRSEEHTSELQSRFDLVCRLLLEKNKAQ